MLADTCSVIVQEMLIFCLSCIVGFLFSLFPTSTLQCLWSHCPFDMKNVLIVLWLIISRRGEKKSWIWHDELHLLQLKQLHSSEFLCNDNFSAFSFAKHCILFLQCWTDLCLSLQRINPIPQHIFKNHKLFLWNFMELKVFACFTKLLLPVTSLFSSLASGCLTLLHKVEWLTVSFKSWGEEL